jgi:hypothetical protein
MANTNISKSRSPLDEALLGIPTQFRTRIIQAYLEIKRRYSESAYNGSVDSAGLSVGKLAETILRFLQQHLTSTYIPFGKHIQNFPGECRKLIQLPDSAGLESLRVIIPRALVFLYTLRGKRGIGHVGGDVEANSIDLATIVRVSDWVTCELIRIFHGLSIEEAQAIVDALSTRTIPDIWEVAGKKRVLKQSLDFKQQVLLLAYSDLQGGVLSDDLFSWTEYSNFAIFKKNVLLPLHQKKLIEYDRESEIVYLSPLGVKEVEEKLLRT